MRWIVRGTLLILWWVMSSSALTAAPDSRFERLARGINLPFWFWYAPETSETIDGRFSDDDFALIRDLGFTFVRVPIDLEFVMDAGAPDLLRSEGLAHLDRGLDRLLAHDLAVVIDVHSTSLADSDASNYSGKLEDPAFVETFIAFWRAFAAQLSVRDPERVILEPMNEPVFYDDPDAWPPIQARLLAAIREAAPEHTLIATGARWSGLDTLTALEPLDDPNIIYNFHFYEPFYFTHQGAGWSSDDVEPMRGVPYPSSPAAVEPAVARQRDPQVQALLRQYGEERWDADDVAQRIGQAVDWAARHRVRLMCNEFGVYSVYAPPVDRARWIEDVRTALEGYGIPWAMWEYDEGFGLVQRDGQSVRVNKAVARALGLNLPE